MRRLAIYALFIALLFVQACSPRIVEKIVVRDSLITEIHERVIHDSIPYEVPVEIEKIVTFADSSHLENSFAVSEAVVRDGLLHHSLKTKPQTLQVPVDITVADTTTTSTHSEIQTVEVPVEKELNWWQKFRLKGFWWLLGGLILSLLWIFRKFIFRI